MKKQLNWILSFIWIIVIWTIISLFWLISYNAINSINTAWGCIWDYVEKLHNWQLTWWCWWYCDWEYHQDSCDKSFKNIWCKLIAKTNGCNMTLYKPYWKNKTLQNKLIYYTVNSIACRADYLWVGKYGNKNWREIFLNSNIKK